MDFSKFKTSDWLVAGGGLGMLIFGLFRWIKIDVGAFGSESGGNAFDFFFTGTIPWLLLGASAVITVLLAGGVMKRGSLPWPLIILAATALSLLLLLIRVVFNPVDCGFGDCGDVVKRGIGQYLSLISGAVAAVGGFLGFKESGGDLSDLTDMDKLKGAFNQGGGSTPPPPPPPPGMTPPPPPPPPAG
jgi:hypothetical protein